MRDVWGGKTQHLGVSWPFVAATGHYAYLFNKRLLYLGFILTTDKLTLDFIMLDCYGFCSSSFKFTDTEVILGLRMMNMI